MTDFLALAMIVTMLWVSTCIAVPILLERTDRLRQRIDQLDAWVAELEARTPPVPPGTRR